MGMFKRLLCKHNYKAIGLDINAKYTIYQCKKCLEISTGGLSPLTIVIPPRLPDDKRPMYHTRHTYTHLNTYLKYACTGCSQEIIYKTHDSRSCITNVNAFYGKIIEAEDVFEDEET